MKNLKLVFTALVLLAFMANMQAQEAKPAKQRPQLTEAQKEERKAQFEENKKRLALSPEQEKSFKEINKKFHQEIKGIKDGEGDRTEKAKKVKEIKDRKDEEVKKILSEQQFKTYLDIQKERHKNRREKRMRDSQEQ
ncbi:hypothetical protein [Flavobacterium sp.]|uniref:hypothetical protein n=1 Tax=Flavobacterium sp. TaxID=239 RepID=UPI0039E5F5D0